MRAKAVGDVSGMDFINLPDARPRLDAYLDQHAGNAKTQPTAADTAARARAQGIYRRADFRGLSLAGADFSNVEFIECRMEGAVLVGCNMTNSEFGSSQLDGSLFSGCRLHGARFSKASLRDVRFQHCVLTEANFRRADLRQATLTDCDLTNALLNEADLHDVVLHRVVLRGANLHKAMMGEAVFIEAIELTAARGLHGVVHSGPSHLDHHTLRSCAATLPRAFAEGVGFTPPEWRALLAVYGRGAAGAEAASAPPKFGDVHVYISAGREAAELVAHLTERLRAEGIAVWQIPSAATASTQVSSVAAPAVRPFCGSTPRRQATVTVPATRNCLLLVCTEEHLNSAGVTPVVLDCIDQERRGRLMQLYAIAADPFLRSDRAAEIGAQAARMPPHRTDWVQYLRAQPIPDFTYWKNPRQFEPHLQQLIQSLREPSRR